MVTTRQIVKYHSILKGSQLRRLIMEEPCAQGGRWHLTVGAERAEGHRPTGLVKSVIFSWHSFTRYTRVCFTHFVCFTHALYTCMPPLHSPS
jgi:hypothetical protein